MSTLTHAAPTDRHDTPRARIVSGRLVLVFGCSLGTLTSFYLLLSVTPLLATAAGAGSAGAGLVTGVLMLAGVAAEFVAPSLMNRFGNATVLALGLALLGAPTLLLLASDQIATIVAVSLVRGLGFGLLVVVTGALVVSLAPRERRGEAVGLSGVVSCVPGVVALPSGVWLAGHVGYALVIAVAGLSALAPLAAVPWLTGVADRRAAGDPGAEPPIGLLAGLRRGEQLRPALAFAATTVSAGVVVAFVPLATGASGNIAAVGLFVQAIAATIGRWWAGRQGDRHGHGRLLIPGLVIAAGGMAGLVWATNLVTLTVAMAAFGTGFGICQTSTLTQMMDRVPASGYGMVSALWNMAYDLGYGAGPAAFGLFVSGTGYPAAFAVTAVVILIGLAPAWRDRTTRLR
jgi:predicted MFS family arabinose efflux permease